MIMYTTNVIRNALSLLFNETDVRSAPETNSAISDVMNDEHVSSVVAWSRDLRASTMWMQSSNCHDKFRETAVEQNIRSQLHTTYIFFVTVRPEFLYFPVTATSEGWSSFLVNSRSIQAICSETNNLG